MSIDRINALTPEEAKAEFLRCCGSARWAKQMVERRPFSGTPDLFAAAEDIWHGLSSFDWIEAFSRHPRIGDLDSLRARFSFPEQKAAGGAAGVREAPEEILKELADSNRLYQKKFGFIFIVSTTRTNAAEMLTLLRERLNNDVATELKIASEEQNKITRLRLQKLLQS
jgi:2-oxo-4-hydroxy-4-carboxy-5-ureidoimidazoline decarboxylase